PGLRGARRSADSPGGGRCAKESCRGNALFRRAYCRRDRRGAAGLARYGETRLETGKAVVAARIAGGQARCRLIAGGRLRISVTRRSRAVPKNVGRFS